MSTDHGTDVLSGIYVSGDLLELIVSTLDAKELAIISKVSKATLHAAQAVASSKARALAESLGCADRKLAAWAPGAATERRLRCLREWELVEEHNLTHLRADKLNLVVRDAVPSLGSVTATWEPLPSCAILRLSDLQPLHTCRMGGMRFAFFMIQLRR